MVAHSLSPDSCLKTVTVCLFVNLLLSPPDGNVMTGVVCLSLYSSFCMSLCLSVCLSVCPLATVYKKTTDRIFISELVRKSSASESRCYEN